MESPRHRARPRSVAEGRDGPARRARDAGRRQTDDGAISRSGDDARPRPARPRRNRRGRRHLAAHEAGPRANDGFARRLHGVVGPRSKPTEANAARRRTTSDESDDRPGFELARIETHRRHAAIRARTVPTRSVNKLRSKWDISFPQAMIWGILACAAGFAISIVRERKQGTFLRLQVAPVSRGSNPRRQSHRLLSRRDRRDRDHDRARRLARHAARESCRCSPSRPSASPSASSAS